VVPEKQGLKPSYQTANVGDLTGLSSGSRKTRIETLDKKRLGSHDLSLSSGSRKTRIETSLDGLDFLRVVEGLSSGSRKTRIETPLLILIPMATHWSKQWFQKNKD